MMCEASLSHPSRLVDRAQITNQVVVEQLQAVACVTSGRPCGTYC